MFHPMSKKSPGRPKDPKKNSEIIEAATRLFLERGFAATSMESVAQRAGVSKQTLYSHFGGKDELFKQVIKTKVDHYQFTDQDAVLSGNLARDLTVLGERVFGLLLDQEAVDMMRVVIGESRQQPKAAGLFFQMGPERISLVVKEYLQRQQDAGVIPAGDTEELSYLFINMLKGVWYMASLMGIKAEFTKNERKRYIETTVKRFVWLLEMDKTD